MSTISYSDDRFCNQATYETYQWLTHHAGTPKLVSILCSGSRSIGEFADNVEGFLWILWEGKIEERESLKPVNWVEIAEAWIDDHQLDADTFFNDLHPNPN